jgi:hypothetical protein
LAKTRRHEEYEDSGYNQLSFAPFCDDFRHLVCLPYSVENLHIIAKELGIGRSWFHEGRLPHYDIPKKRVDEITSLCNVISTRDIVRIIKGQIGNT